jgi:hypothetical protein
LANLWLALRRPLLVSAVLGCSISLMAAGRLTLRLALPSTIYWSFIPLLELAALAAVCRPLRAKTIDAFFQGHRAWLLWLIAFAAVTAIVPAPDVIAHVPILLWYISAILAFLWSAHVDFNFSRRVLERSRAAAARDVLIQRLICWPAAFVIFVWSAGSQVIASGLGL